MLPEVGLHLLCSPCNMLFALWALFGLRLAAPTNKVTFPALKDPGGHHLKQDFRLIFRLKNRRADHSLCANQTTRQGPALPHFELVEGVPHAADVRLHILPASWKQQQHVRLIVCPGNLFRRHSIQCDQADVDTRGGEQLWRGVRLKAKKQKIAPPEPVFAVSQML